MAQFRNITADLRFAPFGFGSPVAVRAGDVLDVPDDVAESYACQPAIWQAVSPKAPTVAPDPPSEG